ncbi:eukaryotic translation initiation factor eIF2A-domain-containing protein [Lipomyces arxii]|uniref:eukaryotic translation initiation factor eIF2A-domain-containing protein n=1 Tax=Lipomyces arxii TaxID=56418 RepID=UPI0034CDB85B
MPIPQLYYRTSKTIGLLQSAPAYDDIPGFKQPSGTLRTCVYAPSGDFFAYTTADAVFIVDSNTGAVTQTLTVTGAVELAFSPKGSYLCTYERPLKIDEGQTVHYNFKIWQVSNGEKVAQFLQKVQTMHNFQFTFDEKFCARLVPNELQFFETAKLGTPASFKLKIDGCSAFAISPGQSYYIAVFVPELKGRAATVQVYNAPNFSQPLSTKSLFKAEKAGFQWNAIGTSLLVLAQTEVDQTGKSYYGESNLYLRGIAGNYDSRIALDKEGPIHDVAWSPNSKEFAVVYGYMPAKTTIFNNRGDPIRSLPIGPRNTILYSPHARFLIVAGFGNLQGEVDIYDCQNEYSKVTTVNGSNTSVCEWSPDGRYLMFATTSPRLRVDNGVKIFHVSGKLVFAREMNELFSASWRPEPVERYPIRTAISPPPTVHSSAATVEVTTPVKTAGAYRPPHARGSATPMLFKREDEGGVAAAVKEVRRRLPGVRTVPGAAEPVDEDLNLSKTALRNKKKREAKKARDEVETASPAVMTPPAGSNGVAPPPGLGITANGTKMDPTDEKKFRGFMKKLRAIEDLKVRKSRGEKLEDTQEIKINGEASVRASLAALGWAEK